MTLDQGLKYGAEALSAVWIISTTIAHLPFLPPKYAEFFARVGLATEKFSVNQRPL